MCVLLAKLCWPLPCFILYSKAKFSCYSRYLLTFYFCIPVPYDEKDIFFWCPLKKHNYFLTQIYSATSHLLSPHSVFAPFLNCYVYIECYACAKCCLIIAQSYFTLAETTLTRFPYPHLTYGKSEVLNKQYVLPKITGLRYRTLA